MGWSIPILRIAGIQLRIHITFLLLIAWIAFAYYSQGGSSAAVGGVTVSNACGSIVTPAAPLVVTRADRALWRALGAGMNGTIQRPAASP